MPGLMDFFRRLGGQQGAQPAMQPAGGLMGEEQPRPDMFGRMTGGLSRFNENHPGLVFGAGQALAGNDLAPAFNYAADAKKMRKEKQAAAEQENKTKTALMALGFSETDANAALSSKELMNEMLLRQSGRSAEYGLTPQYGIDAEGNPVLIQLSKDGRSQRTALPEGVTLSKAPIKMDAGTHFVLLDPITRQQIGIIPKENYQEAFDSGRGAADAKAQAEAAQALPGVAGMAGLIDSQIQGLKNDPYLPEMVGPINSRFPNISGDAARVQSKIDQLQGGAFLQARQMLKGGGAITDIEGQKAEAAFVRMNQAQSVDDFKAALDEFNAAVQQGLRKLQAQAGQQPPAGVGGGYKQKYGLD